ncbi:phage portal protein, HK97 family [Chelatococcus sambhunathii]|uniref:Phage portal protein, HK97 family n=1 Tax=Chelatococcus sambhunathii TaxID=363953 RepID=A0ABP2A306_9HYPH|nr:phage portal protein [Chelatococcus sambhunathii]CUA87991.1 phage portal protein, HK97 family [Chelatococcus sambhunathii]
MMAAWIDRWTRRRAPARLADAVPETKASRVAPLLAIYGVGRPVWTSREFEALAREGFSRNPVVHRCVKLVAEAAASVPWVLHDGAEEPERHPLLDLVRRPNPREDGGSFLESLFSHLLVAGNAYAEAVCIGEAPRELYVLRPDRMRVVPGGDGWPAAYDYTVGGRTVRLARREGSPVEPVLHLRLFNPVDDHYGLSPMGAAAGAVDIHNAASAWNKALLDNAARPSGALVYKGPDGVGLTDTQFERLKGELEQQFQGRDNAGRPLLLDGGLDWRPLSLSPKDMDFVEAKAAAAREIALAFGVPPMLLGLPGDNTYANFAEANRSFWRQTVIPLAQRAAASVAHWLAPAFGGELRFEIDLDRIDALAGEREALWRRISSADFLSEDEKREAVGYGRRERLPQNE